MLSLITGKQRSGKTFYCVTLILDYLRQYKERNIFTNLPLNPDLLCRVAAGRNNIKYMGFLRRIHLFKSFRTFKEARNFYVKNPDYCKLHQIIPEQGIKEFWTHTKPNSVIFLDEVYQWFSAGMYKEADATERRKQLLAYSRQHGHYKDDMYLISHKLCDVDKHIRDGTQYFYIVRNSKYTNVFQWRWMRGFKWPFQFFIIQGFEDGDSELSDSWNVWPDKRIFKCYNSFSSAETIPGKSLPDTDAESTDTGVNFWWNFKRFVGQCWMGLAILGGLLVGGCYAYKAINTLTGMKSSDITAFGSSSTKAPGVQGAKKDLPSLPDSSIALPAPAVASQPPITAPVRYAKVKSIMPNMLIFEDDYILRKGGTHEGLEVVSIHRDYTVLKAGEKTYNVRNIGLHELPPDYVRPGDNNKRYSQVSVSSAQLPNTVTAPVQSVVSRVGTAIQSYKN